MAQDLGRRQSRNRVMRAWPGLVGFVLGTLFAAIMGWSGALSQRIPGIIAVLIGIVMIVIPYFTLVENLLTSTLERGNATIGMSALKASQYLLIGGMIVVFLGMVSILRLLPWL